MLVKRKFYVTHQENQKYWNGKLSTWRNGFCWITRSGKPYADPDEIHDDLVEISTPSGHKIAVSEDIVMVISKD